MKLYLYLFLISIIHWRCQCEDILCTSPPPSIQVRFLDKSGKNLLNQNLNDPAVSDIQFLTSASKNYYVSYTSNDIDSFMRVALLPPENRMILKIKDSVIDSFQLTFQTIKGSECCSDIQVLQQVSNKSHVISFTPYLDIQL